jgi:pyruvate,water dikinase
MTDHIIELGTGRASAHGVGAKAANLDYALRKKLTVPPGVILLDAAYRDALAQGIVTREGDRLTLNDPYKLAQWLALPRFPGEVAVRSAFSTEDAPDSAQAGAYASVLHVQPGQPAALGEAVLHVWNSAEGTEGRRDVLIQSMVLAERAGVAFTEAAHEDDLINWTAGTAEKLLAGQVAGESMPLAKLRRWEHSITLTPEEPWAWRLQVLLREVRTVFGAGDWDIEWADDGGHCWLVQIRPVTRPTRRDEVFTIANHKEILPELPSPLMTSVVESCAPGLFGYYRQFDPALPADRPFIEVFAGRPFINLSLLLDMMRMWGLPTAIVTDSIGGETSRPAGFNWGRAVRKAPVLLRQGLAQLRAVSSAQRAGQRILQRTSSLPGSFGGLVDELRWVYTTLVTEMFSLTAAIGPILGVLRSMGVLAYHSAGQQTVSTAMYTDLHPLRKLAQVRPAIAEALEDGELPLDDETFAWAWQAYLSKHGHRGIYESDIARPRFHEAPDSLLALINAPPQQPPDQRRAKLPTRLLAALTAPLWWQAGRSIRAREQFRYTAMRGFDRIRQGFLALAEQAAADGQLPGVDALWKLRVDEVRRLDEGWVPSEAFWQERHAELDQLRATHPPDLFGRFDDWGEAPTGQPPTDRWSGVSLTVGEVAGRAWVLREPSSTPPQGFDPAETILVARSVDAGWIPAFGQVAGVVVETGGDLSHGSIILREIGLPAVTNVSGVTRHIQTGDRLRLDAGRGLVTRQK